MSKEYLTKHRETIAQLIEKEKVFAHLQLREFERYTNLIRGSENEKIVEFMKNETDQNFESYRNLIAHYDRLSRNIKVEFNRTYFAGFFVVHRGELIEHIATAARILKEDLVAKMISEYEEKSRAYVSPFFIQDDLPQWQ